MEFSHVVHPQDYAFDAINPKQFTLIAGIVHVDQPQAMHFAQGQKGESGLH